MPVAANEIQFFLSGGATNANANASLGGVISGTQITSAQLNNLFDDITGAQSAAGSNYVDYRCLYVKNANATGSTLSNISNWLSAAAAASGVQIAIGLDPAGIGDGSTTGVATTIANETTAPAGVTFSSPTTAATGLNVAGPLGNGQAYAVWIRRTVPAGGATAASDSITLNVQGDSSA